MGTGVGMGEGGASQRPQSAGHLRCAASLRSHCLAGFVTFAHAALSGFVQGTGGTSKSTERG